MDIRRPTPSVERRRSSVGKKMPAPRHATLDARHSGNPRTGMTLIELGVVMGIITVLIALVLGLSRHVNAVVKIRRAQVDLGEWHEALNAWYLKYGFYPDPTAPQFNIPRIESNLLWLVSTTLNQCYYADLTSGRVYFRSVLSQPLPIIDPWGTPYFYRSTTNAYELLSCGPNLSHDYVLPNAATETFPEDASRVQEPNVDDIYFEP